MKSAFVSPEISSMAYELADEAARRDIESACSMKWGWYDTGNVPLLDIEFVRKALAYLEARGLINRHPENSALVNFKS